MSSFTPSEQEPLTPKSGRALSEPDTAKGSWARGVSRQRTLGTPCGPTHDQPGADVAMSPSARSPSYVDVMDLGIKAFGLEDKAKSLGVSEWIDSARNTGAPSGQDSARSGQNSARSGLYSARSTGVFGLSTPRESTRQLVAPIKQGPQTKGISRERRGMTKDGKDILSPCEICDAGCEGVAVGTVEDPRCCPAAIKHSAFYERLCTPATFQRRDHEAGDGAADAEASTNKHESGALPHFGFHKFKDSGFLFGSFCSAFDDAAMDTGAMSSHLGLEVATHRKTSVQRLCLLIAKEKLLPGVPKHQIIKCIRDLKKCDHINMLRLVDVFEDPETLYLMYEHFPCVSFSTVINLHSWSEEQIANLVREICAAATFASSLNVCHLGWSLCHVLLHKSCLLEDPRGSKIFGFGLFGNLTQGTSVTNSWAPEAVEAFQRSGDSFIHRMEQQQKETCDIWGLGTMVYAMIARKMPFLGQPDDIPRIILAKQWSFGIGFDDVDGEAKWLIEGFMASHMDRRAKAKTALSNPWIRRRWKHPHVAHHAFRSLHKFCVSGLCKRLFGRFLVKFLNSQQIRKITDHFSSLDLHGDGIICRQDLRTACIAHADVPHLAFDHIWGVMCPEHGCNALSFVRFCECMAEEVLDGPNLRHAFESLDDDGSECISPEELYNELVVLDPILTIDDVMKYMAETEQQMDAKGGGDKGGAPKPAHTSNMLIEFDEFVQLFPERTKHLKRLEDRFHDTKHLGGALAQSFRHVEEDVQEWIQDLWQVKDELEETAGDLLIVKKPNGKILALMDHLKRIDRLLGAPPGSANHPLLGLPTDDDQKKKEKKKGHHLLPTYGYQTFLQDKAVEERWPSAIEMDRNRVDHLASKRKMKNNSVDRFAVHDTILNVIAKVEPIISWSKGQADEYACFAGILQDLEFPIPITSLSGRGLAEQAADGDEDGQQGEAFDDDGTGRSKSIFGCLSTFLAK